MLDYITKEDTIIFSPKFNKIINDKLLLNYKKVIFSDYELTYILFDNYEKFDYENSGYEWCWDKSQFNQKINLPLNLTYITFGLSFNQKIELPQNLTHLTFGEWFNQEVDLPPNLTHLTFGRYFNQKVDLPPNLTHLTFGRYFNQKVNLSSNLTHLTFGYHFNQKVNLPINLIHLTFGMDFNQKVDIPLNLKYLCLYCLKLSMIDYLPDSLEELKLGTCLNSPLDNLPISLKILKLRDEYDKNKLKNLPKNVKVFYYSEDDICKK